jgi:hypothetical protein
MRRAAEKPCPGTATQRNDGPGGRGGSQTGRTPITPDCGIVGRCDEPVPDLPACARRVPEAFAAVTFGPPFKSAGLILSGFKYYHDPYVISQPDKPLINIRLIHHFLQNGMWIITDFLCMHRHDSRSPR